MSFIYKFDCTCAMYVKSTQIQFRDIYNSSRRVLRSSFVSGTPFFYTKNNKVGLNDFLVGTHQNFILNGMVIQTRNSIFNTNPQVFNIHNLIFAYLDSLSCSFTSISFIINSVPVIEMQFRPKYFFIPFIVQNILRFNQNIILLI